MYSQKLFFFFLKSVNRKYFYKFDPFYFFLGYFIFLWLKSNILKQDIPERHPRKYTKVA